MYSGIDSKLPLFIFAFVLVPLLPECLAGRKRWVSSWDFSDRRNWKDNAGPCPGQPATFRVPPQFPVFLDAKVKLGSLRFPYDAELIFGKDTSLSLSEKKDPSCTTIGKESTFMNKAQGWWFDPNSWECIGDRTVVCNTAVPHINRVPCLRDHAEIPDHEASLYRMMFTAPTPIVKSLSIGNKNLTTSQFTAFAESKHGRGRISKTSASSVYVYIEDDYPCDDLTGCRCHERSPASEVCRFQSPKCPPATCRNPVRMKGFCCKFCGAEISISHNSSLQLSLVSSLLKRVSGTREGRGVDMHVTKMEPQFLHVYFLAKAEDGDYLSASSKFLALFKRDYNSNDYYKVSTLTSEGDFFALKRSQERAKSNLTAGLVSFFVICAIALGVFFFLKKKKSEPGFSFRRFSFHGRRESTLAGTPLPSFSYGAEGLRFVNPGYEVASEAAEVSKGSTMQSSLTTVQEIPEVENPTQRENPLFQIHSSEDSKISFSEIKAREEEAETSQIPTEPSVPAEEDAAEGQLISLQTFEESAAVEDLDPNAEDEEEMLAQLAQSRAQAAPVNAEESQQTDFKDDTITQIE